MKTKYNLQTLWHDYLLFISLGLRACNQSAKDYFFGKADIVISFIQEATHADTN